MRSTRFALALTLLFASGCGQSIPKSWTDELGLPLDDAKVEHGTTPTDTSLNLYAPDGAAPAAQCSKYQKALEAKGYVGNEMDLLRVAADNYNVRFLKGNDQVGVLCERTGEKTLVVLSRGPQPAWQKSASAPK